MSPRWCHVPHRRERRALGVRAREPRLHRLLQSRLGGERVAQLRRDDAQLAAQTARVAQRRVLGVHALQLRLHRDGGVLGPCQRAFGLVVEVAAAAAVGRRRKRKRKRTMPEDPR